MHRILCRKQKDRLTDVALMTSMNRRILDFDRMNLFRYHFIFHRYAEASIIVTTMAFSGNHDMVLVTLAWYITPVTSKSTWVNISVQHVQGYYFDFWCRWYVVWCGHWFYGSSQWLLWQYMVDHLNFPSLQAAKELRYQYFAKYHATAKALTVAHAEGEFQEGAPNLKPSS